MKTYSQFGEDIFIVLSNLINQKRSDGVCVEIGALDGLQYSNTKFFEDTLGFKSILIEPSNSFSLIPFNRPRSSWHRLAITSKYGLTEFLGDTAVAGIVDFMDEDYKHRWKVGSMNSFSVITVPFDAIVALEKLDYIDFLSIDVQGAELEVLNGFSFSIPVGIICIELEGYSTARDNECRRILKSNGFELVGNTHVSEIWRNPSYYRMNSLSSNNCSRLTVDSFDARYLKKKWKKLLRLTFPRNLSTVCFSFIIKKLHRVLPRCSNIFAKYYGIAD